MTSGSWQRRAAMALAGASVVVTFAPILGGACLLGGDMVATFEPLAHALAEGIRHGDIVRTQRLFAGLPLLAHPVVAAVYPPQWLVALIEPARALAILSLLHLALAGAGTAALLQRLGRSATAATAGGVALALSGVAVSSMLQPNLVRALAWMPWMLALAARTLRPAEGSGRPAAALLALVTALLLLCAEPFVAAPALVGALALALPRPEETWVERARPAVRAGGAMAAGALVAGIALVPAARYAAATVRAAGFTAAAAGDWSLHPAQLIGFIVPRPFGDPRLAGPDGFAAVALVPGRSSEYFLSSYAGVLALGLAAGGVAVGGRRERGALLALACLALLALGVHGPAGFLLDMPGLDALRFPVKWVLPALVPFAVLVAAGAEALADAGSAGRRCRALLLATAAAPAVVAACARPLAAWISSLAPVTLSAAGRAVVERHAAERLAAGAAWSVLVPLAVLGAVVLLGRRGRLRLAPAVVVLGLALDLGVQARRNLTLVPSEVFRSRAPVTDVLLGADSRLRTWVDVASSSHRHPVAPPRTLRDMVEWQRELGMFYSASSSGVALAFPRDIEALAPLRLSRFRDAAEAAPWRERLMLLGAAGVTHVVTMDARLPGEAVPLADVPTRAGVPLVVARNRLALPRARVVPGVVLHASPGELPVLLRDQPPDILARATLVLEADWRGAHPAEAPPGGHGEAWQGAARITAELPGGLDVDVDGDGGVLVVADAWIPGMRVLIDGKESAAFAADDAFVGVVVPPGRHEVRIRCAPWRR